MKESPSPPRRIAPLLTPENRFFWTAGAEGELRFKRCRACRTWIHPPAPHCAACLGKDLAIEAVSGRARLAAYTINHQTWHPAYPPPYVIAIVELDEAPYVRLTTNIVHCAPEALHVGMPVQVRFEPIEDAWLPLFEPVRA